MNTMRSRGQYKTTKVLFLLFPVELASVRTYLRVSQVRGLSHCWLHVFTVSTTNGRVKLASSISSVFPTPDSLSHLTQTALIIQFEPERFLEPISAIDLPVD